MTSDSKAPSIWDRVERWREFSDDFDVTCGDSQVQDAYNACASELEADLRELRAVVELVPHAIEPILDGRVDVHLTSCSRCALEARIGRPK